jgi:hypothetical protein
MLQSVKAAAPPDSERLSCVCFKAMSNLWASMSCFRVPPRVRKLVNLNGCGSNEC